MTADAKPGDPADKITDAKADGAFQGSHRAGYGDKLARVEQWLRAHPGATLASGEGAVLLAEIDQLRRQIEIFVDMAATWVKVGHENERLHDAIDRLRANMDRMQRMLVGYVRHVMEWESIDYLDRDSERLTEADRQEIEAMVDADIAKGDA